MKISEAIKTLKKIKGECGDIDLCIKHEDLDTIPEHLDFYRIMSIDTDTCIFEDRESNEDDEHQVVFVSIH